MKPPDRGEPLAQPIASHVRLVRNTALSLAGIGLLGGGRLVFNVVVGRRFGPLVLGQATIAINTAMFGTLLVAGGWQAASARYIAASLGRGSPGEAAWIFRRTLAHNTAGGIVVAVAVAIALNWIPGVEGTMREALLAGLIVFTYNAYQHLKASSYGFGLVPTYLAHETISTALMLAGLAVVAVRQWPEWVLAPVVAGYVAYSGLALARLSREAAGPTQSDEALWREIKGFTALAVVGTIASAGFLNLSAVFAGRYDSPQALGQFSAALAIVLPVYFFPRALSLAMFPAIAFRHGRDETDAVRRTLDVSGGSLAALLLPAVGVAAIAARYILRVLFGASYEPGAEVLAVMLGATYLSVVQIPWVTALSGTERRWYKVPVIASLLGFAVGLVLWVTLGAAEGARGVAWGYLIGSVPQAVIPIWFAARVFNVRFASVAVRAAIAWGVVVAARMWVDERGWRATALACGVFLVVVGILFARELRVAFSRFVRRGPQVSAGSEAPMSEPPRTQK